ncbi:protein of unknown function [Maridesulfovibrio hydrothermalis AM13 = DSM 14728]|uniref:Uncharacterized protein n=1 Tax=Maridesulfovibrio hydrothermalis AM13 = DSM 14728 TaxID=1121451 RepID=L0RBP9_9BACT|nr:protein of unknown function [Maridesulfovibrio hydrothermalis AM13 = DSM 14728]
MGVYEFFVACNGIFMGCYITTTGLVLCEEKGSPFGSGFFWRHWLFSGVQWLITGLLILLYM